MYNFFEEKFEQINKLKYLMTLAKNDENFKRYRDKLELVLNELNVYDLREEEKELLILTPEELAEFDGKNNKPAYIAIDGMIYDISNIELFKKSPHNELQFGKDLTNEFSECHDGNLEILNKIPIIGMLAEPEEVELIKEVRPYYSEDRLKIISTKELAKYNGENNNKAYVAIDGFVYDVTNSQFLKDSYRIKFNLGTDVSNYYKGNKALLKELEVVGILYDFPENNRGRHENTSKNKFSLGELEIYDGKDGNPAYVAIDGIVYDVSEVELFKKNPHNTLNLGRDITEDFNKCHNGDKSLLAGIPIVGEIDFNLYDIKPLGFNEVREFKVNELKSFNGEDGNPPYVAVFGTVYDLTDMNDLGLRDIKLGCDLTGEYKEIYGNDKTVLKDLKVAGVLTCSLKEV